MAFPFRFHIPIDPLEKARRASRSMRFGGFISSGRDKEGERLLGLDFGQFERSGFFNDNHDKSTAGQAGHPVAGVRRVRKGELLPSGSRAKHRGWWAEGVIAGPRGREIYELAEDLKANGGTRRLGFSVQGTTLERDLADPRDILKAVVRHIAITHCPVNDEGELHILSKAMFAGSAIGNPGATPGQGFALRRESLDPEMKFLEFKPYWGRQKRQKDGLNEDEGTELVRSLYPGLTKAEARRVSRFALGLKVQGAL